MPKQNKIEYLDWKNMEDTLNICKKYVGLTDWSIELKLDYEKLEELANVDFDTYEKRLTVTISDKCKKFDDKKMYNILLHELVHGRFGIMQDRAKELIDRLEEEFVNDIVRGFERK